MKKQIILFNLNGWNAGHFDADGNPDFEIVSLFGTHVIPTAFTSNAKAEIVLAEIQQLNPDASVSLEPPSKIVFIA